MIKTSIEVQKIPGWAYDPNAPCWDWVNALKNRSKNGRIRKRRIRLWKKDDRCRLCREKTILPEMVAIILNVPLAQISDKMSTAWRDRLATLDHVYSRFSPHRKRVTGLAPEDESRTRLLCWKCNNALSYLECAELEIEKQRRRSRHLCKYCQSIFLETKLTPIDQQRHHVKTVCLKCGAIMANHIRFLKHTV